jgi:hypothetical protein
MAADDQTPPREAETVTPGEHAAPPPAEDRVQEGAEGESKESLLEAVQKAVPELRENAEKMADRDERASPAQAAKDKPEDEAELPDEATADEIARYSKTAQKRIKKLSKQREALNGEVQRLKTLEPSAQAADQVTTYLRNADIGKDDFLMGLELMAAMRRGDFKTFYEGVKPYVRLCEEYLGVELPPDLQQQVQQGQMTTQAAQMYSRERMDRAMAQSNAARQQQMLQQNQQSHQQSLEQQQKQHLANAVRDTVNAWETNLLRTDPSYSKKQAAVNDTMWAVLREQGAPRSTEHALQIANESLRRVNAHYKSLTPQRLPTYRNPSSTGRTPSVSPEPSSLLDVVRMTREAARS